VARVTLEVAARSRSTLERSRFASAAHVRCHALYTCMFGILVSASEPISSVYLGCRVRALVAQYLFELELVWRQCCRQSRWTYFIEPLHRHGLIKRPSSGPQKHILPCTTKIALQACESSRSRIILPCMTLITLQAASFFIQQKNPAVHGHRNSIAGGLRSSSFWHVLGEPAMSFQNCVLSKRCQGSRGDSPACPVVGLSFRA
jgi:hypothetical protein